MNILKNLHQFNKDCIYLCEPIKNNIMMDGNFIRILYSTELFTMNGIYLFIHFNNISVEKYYNKYRCSFDTNNNILIDSLKNIEEDILKKIHIKDKIPIFKIHDQLRNGNIKIFSENIETIHNDFLLKISGVWETSTNYGVTYKFINL
jgi:hypothetical protein